ncbi:hypothetical protein FRC00_004188 [Tulasnella sp. 408]|nr:hypothetical protein FRC00_004188 [Tulasnella sp. 408]
MTCWQYQRDSIELRYREELLVAGCRDRGLTEGFSPHETPLSTRLSILEAQQARWKSLNWVDVSDWPLTDGCPIYELYGGTFAQIWDNYIHESGKRRSNLNVVHLPSESRGIKNLQKIAHESLGYGVVVELGIDPEQDLVMLIHQISLAEDSQRSPLRDKFVIDFLTMNTHGHHPASCGIIEYEPVHTSSDGRYRITPLIMGDLLGIMFNAMDGSPATLTIWRWTSGKQLLCLETPRPALWFSFLSETTFVVPCMDRDVMTATLHIYRIPDEVLDPANDARHTDPSPVILNPLPEAEYLLPPFNDKSITGYSLVCRSHPLPAPRAYVPPRPTRANPNSEGVQTTAQPAPAEPSVPDPPTFQVDPDERIMTFSFIFNVYYDDSMGHGIVAWQESYVLATHSTRQSLFPGAPGPIEHGG